MVGGVDALVGGPVVLGGLVLVGVAVLGLADWRLVISRRPLMTAAAAASSAS